MFFLWSLSSTPITKTTLVFDMRGLMWHLLDTWEDWVLISFQSKNDRMVFLKCFCHLYDALYKQQNGVCSWKPGCQWLRLKSPRSLRMIAVKDEERAKKCRNGASKSPPVTLGWALLPTACTDGKGEGGGAFRKSAVLKGEESEREREATGRGK